MINCPICRSDNTRHYYSNEGLNLLRCKRCGVKFQHPMPTPEFLRQVYSSEYYDSFYPKRVLGEQKYLFGNHLEMIERLRGGRKGRALDVGSGRGIFIEAARDRGWDCIGQEFSEDAAIALKNHLGIDVVVCRNLSEAKFQPKSFDLVNMNHVLEHLYEPIKAVQEVYRILKPCGFLYCEVPRQNNLLNLLTNIFGKKDFGFSYLYEHLFLFDVPSIRFLLKESGFEILFIKIEGIGDPHRYVYGVHYTSLWTHIIAKVVGNIRLQIPFGGGNLVAVGRKPIKG